MVQLTERQLTFWRELLAPFSPRELSEVKRGISLTYVDARALMNRLDSVVGPNGWDITYRETDRGFIARMGIRIPTNTEDGWEWMWKEDGGGYEGMTKKAGGETVEDTDNDEKSAFTNSFRRVAQNAWGIGRYLYKKGAPTWLGDESLIPEQDPASRTAPQSAPAQQPQQRSEPAPGPPRQFDDFAIPRPGKGVFPTIKRWEEHFKIGMMDGFKKQAKQLGCPSMFDQIEADDVNTLFNDLVDYICTLGNYDGEFAKIRPLDQWPSKKNPASKPADPPPAQAPAAAAPPADPELAKLRKDIVAAAKEAESLTWNRPATQDEVGYAIGGLARAARTKDGVSGQTMTSLRDCVDAVWMRNILEMFQREIAARKAPPPPPATAAPVPADEDDIPF